MPGYSPMTATSAVAEYTDSRLKVQHLYIAQSFQNFQHTYSHSTINSKYEMQEHINIYDRRHSTINKFYHHR